MTSQGDNITHDDFFVGPQLADPTSLIQSIASIKKAIRTSEIRDRKDSGESDDSYIVRLALAYEAVSAPLFRKRKDADAGRVAAWLGTVKQRADYFLLNNRISYQRRFTSSDVEAIAKLSSQPEGVRQLAHLLFERHQIVLIVERAFVAMKLDGCTFRLPSGHPVVGLSLRYARYDSFWFTLLHELAHVAMHYDSLDEVILDDFDSDQTSLIEIEANRLAASSLIPPAYARRLFRRGEAPDEGTLARLAQELQTHPSIIAGMYRHELNLHTIYSDLVNSIDVRKLLEVSQ